MVKPHGRKTKKKVKQILMGNNRETAMALLKQIPDEQLVGHLFSHFYHMDDHIKFRSITAMGVLGKRVAKKNMEKARVILRRMMWNLNDESGGIGWGSPEAMGETLGQSPELALEFKSILFSYLDPGGNFIEHEALQRGVLWGIGTFLETHSSDLNKNTKAALYQYLRSDDPVKRGYAVRALINARSFDYSLAPENIFSDHHHIELFDGWNFVTACISDMALNKKNLHVFA